MTIRIVTDSACDLPNDVALLHSITIVPLSIRFGTEEFIDRVDLTTEQFWERCAASPELPETAAPSPGQFESAFRQLAASGASGILVISLSSKLSATMQSAEVAAKSLVGSIPIRVIDSRSASMGEGMTAVSCAKLANSGGTLDQVAELAIALSGRTKVWAALDTLDALKKGGRIGGAKALLASALSIKPIIAIIDGKVAEGGRQRTRSKAIAFLIDKVREAGPIENLAVLQAQCQDTDILLDGLRSFYPGDIVVGDIGAVIGSHVGQGTIGVGFVIAK
ncbi:MAG: DegV family protein [Ilumatobacteraceae bacterium]